MTKVLIDGGRTADTADYIDDGTIGNLAQGIAGTAFDLMESATVGEERLPPARQFSFKVGGVLIHPDTPTGDVALHDENVVELVEVTDQDWSTPETVLEIGVPHDAANTVTAIDVPEGTVAELLDWVGDDIDRARAVIAAELLQAEPRTTLIEALESHFDLPSDDDPNV